MVAGVTAEGQFYVLDDRSCRLSPDGWGRVAIEAYHNWKADRIIAETNNGGDMVGLLMQTIDPTITVTKVNATRGKRVRAEPISALYEQNRVHHVGSFPQLEDQMVTWTPDVSKSPDRMDALVWAITELNEGSSSMIALSAMAIFCPSCRMPAPKSAVVCPKCGTALGEK